MNSRDKSIGWSLVFVLLFAQQIICFQVAPFMLRSSYWIVIFCLTLSIGFFLNPVLLKDKQSIILLSSLLFGSFCSFLNGSSIDHIIIKLFFSFTGYLLFSVMATKKIELRFFDFLLIFLYFFYYCIYFRFDITTRQIYDGFLFGHSSSNTISIVLTTIWTFYFLISKNQGDKTSNLKLLLFSIINLVMIALQGSRMGIIVAIVSVFLILYEIFSFNKKSRLPLYFILVAFMTSAILSNLDALSMIVELDNMGYEAYGDDVRSDALVSYFNNMTIQGFFFGYNSDVQFDGLDRTFNAFIEIWRSFGLLPFVVIVFLFIYRLVFRERYKIPFLYLLPLLLYSITESFWGTNFWDMTLYILFFYSHEKFNSTDFAAISQICAVVKAEKSS